MYAYSHPYCIVLPYNLLHCLTSHCTFSWYISASINHHLPWPCWSQCAPHPKDMANWRCIWWRLHVQEPARRALAPCSLPQWNVGTGQRPRMPWEWTVLKGSKFHQEWSSQQVLLPVLDSRGPKVGNFQKKTTTPTAIWAGSSQFRRGYDCLNDHWWQYKKSCKQPILIASSS